MTIADIARTDVVTVDVETPVSEIADVMADERVGSVVVVDEDGAPYGIVTDRDLVVYVLRLADFPAEATARNVMAFDVFTVEADTGVLETIRRMREERVRRVPVVDGDELVGIVTLDDLVVLLAEELEALADIIAAESPPYDVADPRPSP